MLDAFIWLSGPGALAAVCALSWWRGAAAEKFGSLIILLADVSANIAMVLAYPKFPGLSMCAIDFALACSLLFIALKYSNLWLGGAMLLQSLALCLQAFEFIGEGPSTSLHYVINDAISYAMLACLIAGLVGSWRTRETRMRRDHHIPLPTDHAVSL